MSFKEKVIIFKYVLIFFAVFFVGLALVLDVLHDGDLSKGWSDFFSNGIRACFFKGEYHE